MKNLQLNHIAPIVGIVLAVVWNIPHLVSVYAETVGEDASIYHYAMMVIIEFSVLVFALKKYEYSAKTFAWFIFFLNLYYYFDFNQDPITWDFSYAWFAFSRIIFSALPAYLIAFYSEMFANTFTGAWMDDRQELEKIRNRLAKSSSELEKNKKELARLRKLEASIRSAKDRIIRVDGVKATVCKCDNLVIAGSNRENNRVCSCGELIEWQ